MNSKEKELFKSICSFKSESFDETLLKFATPEVLGHLFFNRMQAIAYGTLLKHELLGKVNREFRNSLKCAHEQNVKKNTSYFWFVQYLENILSNCDCEYAMLKGAYLCHLYPEGYRTSNDIDLLVHPDDVTVIGNILLDAGFKQGHVRNGKFESATRKEIIESRMMRGETVPYIKEINLPGLQFLEVDINFSVDYKPGETDILEQMVSDIIVIDEPDGFKIHTLSKSDFFIHLCSHLYKEATTLPWVEMQRDMALYKYCDIYVLLNEATKKDIDELFIRTKELQMGKICAFAILQTSELFYFKNDYAIKVTKEILEFDEDFIHTVISPKDKKKYVFTEKNISNRFFSNDRKSLLKEVKPL